MPMDNDWGNDNDVDDDADDILCIFPHNIYAIIVPYSLFFHQYRYSLLSASSK